MSTVDKAADAVAEQILAMTARADKKTHLAWVAVFGCWIDDCPWCDQ